MWTKVFETRTVKKKQNIGLNSTLDKMRKTIEIKTKIWGIWKKILI